MIEFFVGGTPVAQGSMIAVPNKRGGKPIIKPANEKKLRQWRKKISRSALMTGAPKLAGAVRLTATFYLSRPHSVRRTLPTVRPDLDKLTRAICDGMTGVLIEDDSQVTTLVTMKRYGSNAVGCVIRLEADG